MHSALVLIYHLHCQSGLRRGRPRRGLVYSAGTDKCTAMWKAFAKCGKEYIRVGWSHHHSYSKCRYRAWCAIAEYTVGRNPQSRPHVMLSPNVWECPSITQLHDSANRHCVVVRQARSTKLPHKRGFLRSPISSRKDRQMLTQVVQRVHPKWRLVAPKHGTDNTAKHR